MWGCWLYHNPDPNQTTQQSVHPQKAGHIFSAEPLEAAVWWVLACDVIA